MTTDLDLDAIQAILDRTEQLLTFGKDSLSTFWDPAKPNFFASETAKGSGNVTTTCFCVFSLLKNPSQISRYETTNASGVLPPVLERVGVALRDTPWDSEKLGEYNIYTTPIVVACLAKLKVSAGVSDGSKQAIFNAESEVKIDTGIEKILDNLKTCGGAARFGEYLPSAYLTYWCFNALSGAISASLVPDASVVEKCQTAIENMGRWAEADVHKQIALYVANDLSAFDPTQLGFGLTLWIRSAKDRDSFNTPIVVKALDILFQSQASDGVWPKGQPIFHYQTRGSVFVFGFELLDVLLEHIPSNLLRPHLANLTQALQWAEVNRRIHGKTSGWRSNQLGFPGGAEGWSTAAIVLFLSRFAELLDQYRNEQVLAEFRAVRPAAPNDSRLDPKKFYDAEVRTADGLIGQLKSILVDNLITPHKPGGDEKARRYSAVFYGPPGTANTSLAEAIAHALGWPYVYLQTGDFSGDGFEAITGRARVVFRKLGMLRNAVILFDEVEEFVRDRDEKVLPPASKMITTSMLSLIQELRQRKRVLFIVTTNFLKNFDAAITRPGGRFDMLLLVPPPSLDEKIRMFREKAEAHGTLSTNAGYYTETFKQFVTAHKNPIEYFAYTEWASFTDEAVKRLACLPQDVTAAEELRDLLDERKDGITIRGTLRDDYIASKAMTRIW